MAITLAIETPTRITLSATPGEVTRGVAGVAPEPALW